MTGVPPNKDREEYKELFSYLGYINNASKKYEKYLVNLTQDERREFETITRIAFVKALIENLAANAIESKKEKSHDIKVSLEIFRKIVDLEFSSDEVERGKNLTHLIRSVARIAFHAGKLSDKELEEIVAESQHHFFQKINEKSIVKRQEKAAVWHARALDLMLKSRDENPAGTLDDLADYVLKHWRSGKRPGRDSLKKQAPIWIRKGNLPPKKK